MRVEIQNQAVTLKDLLGEGGEARVYKWVDSQKKPHAIKIYKGPHDVDYSGNTPADAANRNAAHQRLARTQAKLAAFPMGMPSSVIAPQFLVYDTKKSHEIVGYGMDVVPQPHVLLRRWSDKAYRETIAREDLLKDLLKLHQLVRYVHNQAVIGDFNDLNVLMADTGPYIIDADSWQYARWFCTTFTQRFGDPRLCDPKADSLQLMTPHDKLSDWYAFNIMVFQTLMFVTPFDGVFKPKNLADKIPHDARPLHNISVFHPEVKYPGFANKPDMLPDELAQHFFNVFEKRARAEFPERLLDNLRLMECPSCKKEHGRQLCPFCQTAGVTQPVATIHGKVVKHHHRFVNGTILAVTPSTVAQVSLPIQVLEVDEDTLFINGVVHMLKPHWRHSKWRVSGDGKWSYTGMNNGVLGYKSDQGYHITTVDMYQGALPAFDVYGDFVVWSKDDRLQISRVGADPAASHFLGDVVGNGTMVWLGSEYGFGFYRASEYQQFFTFRAETRGLLKDGLPVPPLRGQLIDATAKLSGSHCWFFSTIQRGTQTINRCSVIDCSTAQVLGYAEAVSGDGTWLGAYRGHLAVGKFLFAATDDGLERVEVVNGVPQVVKTYPDTEPFVDSSCQLFASGRGLLVVTAKEIFEITMN